MTPDTRVNGFQRGVKEKKAEERERRKKEREIYIPTGGKKRRRKISPPKTKAQYIKAFFLLKK